MRGDSLFEEEIRKLPIPTCKAFLKDGKLSPVAFKEAGDLVCDPRVKAAFPTLRTAVLEPDAEAMRTIPTDGAQKRVAVLFSGGPAAGGHNVLVGLKRMLTGHTLLGVKGGPAGLLAGDLFEIKDISGIVNTGGFDFLGTDRTKIKRPEQIAAVIDVCARERIDAIVIIGGDDSNTNAAIMVDPLLSHNIQVVSVPKTMDGDVQIGGLLPVPFGYDTACRVYAEMVGNILQDTASSRKYWHFVKVMGRTASQVALEVALQTRPHVTVIGEEVEAKRESIHDVVGMIADAVVNRARRGMDYGVALIPEGLLEFVPEARELIDEIDGRFGIEAERIGAMDLSARRQYFAQLLRHARLFTSLPPYVQEMLVADRDAHGNLKVAQIPTERLLAELVAQRVKELLPASRFAAQTHEFGYEGRCGAPTAFDAMLAYNLGLTAASLVLDGRTGCMAAFTDLASGGTPLGLPLRCLLAVEQREGKEEYVIRKALVKLDAPAFTYFAQRRDDWAKEDSFRSPGPRQRWGPASDQLPQTVVLNQRYDSDRFWI